MRWIWIDRIVDLQRGERCVAIKNVSLAEEHLHDHFPAADGQPARPVMPASLMIEGTAQTAGILVGHARDFAERVILAKITKATFERDVFPGQTLRYTAAIERIDDAGASTTCLIDVIDPATSEVTPVGRTELMFSHLPAHVPGLNLPEHNFVFTSQFMDLLHNSGFG